MLYRRSGRSGKAHSSAYPLSRPLIRLSKIEPFWTVQSFLDIVTSFGTSTFVHYLVIFTISRYGLPMESEMAGRIH